MPNYNMFAFTNTLDLCAKTYNQCIKYAPCRAVGRISDSVIRRMSLPLVLCWILDQ